MKNFIILILAVFLAIGTAGAREAYVLFDSSGNRTDFETMVAAAQKADITFFGELHNNPISHWLQYELAVSLFERAGGLTVGMEMFEADDQLKLDEYLTGLIAQANFEREARVWKNYATDYKPIIEFAKEKGIRIVATNIPRRYAALVAVKGLTALSNLSAEAKKYFPPLPILVDLELPGYKKMGTMINHAVPKKMDSVGQMPLREVPGGGKSQLHKVPPQSTPQTEEEQEAQTETSVRRPAEIMNNFKEAQAVKDATMAHFILKNVQSGTPFLHLNGSYHSDNFEGIVWFVRRDAPKKKIISITTVEEDNVDALTASNIGKADFILVVPKSMAKTH